MDPDIEINTDDKREDNAVSFVDDGSDTIVTVGEERKEQPRDDDRWRQAEEDRRRLASSFDELRSRLAGGNNGSGQAPSAPDPYKSQEDAITEEERALGIQWEAHKVSGIFQSKPELLKEFDGKARDLQQRRVNIATQRAIANAMPQIIGATQAQSYRQQYGDVQSHPNANQYARGQYDILRAQGHPDSPDTVDLAMNAARRAFNLRGARSAPTDRDRDQLTGYSNTRRTNMDPKSNVVKMGKAEKGMAMAMYGQSFNGDEKKVYSTWAKNVGLRAQKAIAKSRNARGQFTG